MTKYEIFDNFLNKNYFETLKEKIFNSNFPWFFENGYVKDNEENEEKVFFYSHSVFNYHSIQSQIYNDLLPMIELLDIKSLIRIRINSTPNLNINYQPDFHCDQSFEHKGAIFYLNNTNGYTILENNEKIDCIENRLLKFDSSKNHTFKLPTNQKRRIIINFNYF